MSPNGNWYMEMFLCGMYYANIVSIPVKATVCDDVMCFGQLTYSVCGLICVCVLLWHAYGSSCGLACGWNNPKVFYLLPHFTTRIPETCTKQKYYYPHLVSSLLSQAVGSSFKPPLNLFVSILAVSQLLNGIGNSHTFSPICTGV